jgi:hypothetical protein
MNCRHSDSAMTACAQPPQHVLRLDPKSLEAPVEPSAMWFRNKRTHGATSSDLASVKAELAALRAQVCMDVRSNALSLVAARVP